MAALTAAALVTAAGTAYAADQSSKAAKASQRGYDAATREQARQFDLGREDTQPYRDVGKSALNQLAQLYGLSGDGANAPDYSAFYDSPDYQFARDEGMRGIERSAAARGGLASGNTLAALSQYNSGLATQNFNNYANRLAGLSGAGQQSSENLAAARASYGQQVGQNMVGAANARASGIQNQANIITSGANQLAGIGGYYYGQRQPQPYGGVGYGGGSTSGYGGPMRIPGGSMYG